MYRSPARPLQCRYSGVVVRRKGTAVLPQHNISSVKVNRYKIYQFFKRGQNIRVLLPHACFVERTSRRPVVDLDGQIGETPVGQKSVGKEQIRVPALLAQGMHQHV